jgi:uncharacterized protein YecT (DUF1311 family)
MSLPRNLSLSLLAACWLLPAAFAQTALPQSAAPPGPVIQAPTEQTIDPCLATLGQPDSDACYAAEFKSADQDLNHMYRGALVALEKDLDDAQAKADNGHAAFDTTAIADLKDAQAAWVKYRDLHCAAAGQQFQGGTIEPTIVSRCMTVTTRHRIEDIQEAYEIGGRKLE